MPKKVHQILFALIIINLIFLIILILLSDQISEIKLTLCSMSLISMLILPFGKKGGKYHIATSSSGLIFYAVFFLTEML